MAHREGVVVSRLTPFEGPSSPNGTVNQITTEIRVYWPPNASEDYLLDLLEEAYMEAQQRIIVKVAEGHAESADADPVDELLDEVFGPIAGNVDSILGSMLRRTDQDNPTECLECHSPFAVSKLGLCAECGRWA